MGQMISRAVHQSWEFVMFPVSMLSIVLQRELTRTKHRNLRNYSSDLPWYSWRLVLRGKAPFNVDSLTLPHPQPIPSTSCCPLLPVSLSGSWQTLWSGLLGAAHMCVCSLSHLVAWHAAQCASSISVYPAWRREIKQKKTAIRFAVREEAAITGGIWVLFPSERRLLDTLMSHKKLALSYDTDIPVTGVQVNCLKALIDWSASKTSSCLFKFYYPAGFVSVEGWCTQLPGNSKVLQLKKELEKELV